MFWIILFLFIFGSGILLLFSRVYISFSLEYSDDKPISIVYVRLYGIRFLKRKIDLSELGTADVWKDQLANKSFKEKLEVIHQVMQSFFDIVSDTMMAMRIFLDKLSIHKIEWYSRFGTGEASTTGLAAGGLWTIKGALIGLVDHLSHVHCLPNIDVQPDFQSKYIYSKFDCMVSIRIGQAIHALIKVIRKSSFRKREVLI
ncbi:DUF2953 domain-containing protein [Virgibacillus dakarensis]|uniref:DUF2953 domain-containing protein n=1 Tax=Virgibacillus dakarensis TaxID=1917889 RepID=UPI000B43FB4D|nr:DUF2953 domain-containing protein [Virgibacillus dakarensis]MBT2216593.1 DUF2953 domain-containing protein [Virgibacillus dakarensis]MTW84315.1 DUF2953 domain-containing protein [Virgibacillus dakarensis]